MLTCPTFLLHYKKLKEKVDLALSKKIESFGEKNNLRDACAYSLMSGGKRVRPIIALLVAEALGRNFDVMPIALSIEFFHTASLIADDLPSMDNEESRRGKLTTHRVFSESTAILATYSLISEGFYGIEENRALLSQKIGSEADSVGMTALAICSKKLGAEGGALGQFLDLSSACQDLESLKDLIYKKTITLFECAFIAGWLFGGGNKNAIESVSQIAYDFGMAFQVADDLNDRIQDVEKGSTSNIAVLLGEEKARAFLEESLQRFESGLKSLNIFTPAFASICDTIKKPLES